MAEHEPPETAVPPQEIPLPPPADPVARCPWCSAPVEGSDAATCSACGATLHGDAEVEIPGVTAIDGVHASRASAPRKVRRTFGALFVGGDDAIPPPSQAELPALAMPDPEVRREMLRIRLDAELADLTARVEALAAERGVPMPVVPDTAPEPDGESQRAAAPEPAGERATDATHPGDDATP
ncbi:MAG TPA: hypothetical protein VIK16_02750 [Candidatus Limnocylindrales bacterium]